MDFTLRERIGDVLDADVRDTTALSGGYVGTVYRVSFADHEPVAAKVADTSLHREARMLRYLDESSPLPVPEIYYADEQLLLMAYVDGDGRWTQATQRDVAEHVAALHSCSAEAYGFEFDTLSGPFNQPNPWTGSWIEFFREKRLLHFTREAHDEGVLPDATVERVRDLSDRLDQLLVEPERPSLLHGDLWAGNLIVAEQSLRVVLDPAIYFGHDELELAYIDETAQLGEAFFERYRECRGIDDGYERRKDVYSAFHALENVRFFGEQALPKLETCLERLGV